MFLFVSHTLESHQGVNERANRFEALCLIKNMHIELLLCI